jgi:hypothetical protein
MINTFEINDFLKTLELEYGFNSLTFFNPATSMVGISASIFKGKVQISFSESLDKNVRGRAKAGEKRFNHEQKIVISLQPAECLKMRTCTDLILQGKYVNHAATDEKYKNTLVFDHMQQKLYVKAVEFKDTKYISLTASSNDEKGKRTIGYMLRADEYKLFCEFMENGYKLLPFVNACVVSLIKSVKMGMFKYNEFIKENPDRYKGQGTQQRTQQTQERPQSQQQNRPTREPIVNRPPSFDVDEDPFAGEPFDVTDSEDSRPIEKTKVQKESEDMFSGIFSEDSDDDDIASAELLDFLDGKSTKKQENKAKEDSFDIAIDPDDIEF